MKKLGIFFLFLILIVSIINCGCLNNENKEVMVNNSNSYNFSNFSENMENTSKKIINLSNKYRFNYTKNNTSNNTNNKKEKIYNFSKDVDMESLFLNLSYEDTIESDDFIIKKYSNGDFNVTFEVSIEPIDFSSAYLYNDVREYPQRDAFGDYIYYEFISKNKNATKSYCYYRKVGKYYIIMQTFEKSRRANDLWMNWTKHIFSLFEEK